MDLEVKVERREKHAIVVCSGELDTYNCGRLRFEAGEVIDEGYSRIVIDLSRVEYIDSTGLGSMVGIAKRLNDRGGKIACFCTNWRILKAFEITGLQNILSVREDLEIAISTVLEEKQPDLRV